VDVKGTAFLARKAMIEREFGAARLAEVLRDASERDPIFATAILATSKIPIEAFLRFNDLMVRALFHGDEQSYFRFGEASAMWALGPDGPYRRLVTDRGVAEFAASAPAIYRNYFDHGEARSEMRSPSVIRLCIVGIDAPYRHVYFEYAIMGYFKRGLEMVSGKTVEMTADKAFSKGDDESVYTFTLR
jgi:hypothetical protein